MEDKNTILIVDDDPALLKMAGEILRGNYAVSCVKSGCEAVALLQTDYVPDIILLDIDMPELNGFDTLTALREIENAQDIPIVFLTGVTRTEAELKGLSCGAVDYITKPFIKEILLARLKVHLENGKRLRQLSIVEKNRQEIRIDEGKFERTSAGLSDTERKVSRLIALGYTNQEIGEALHYSYNYVKKVVAAIYEKKYVSKRSELKKLFL
ncbi:response regulator [Desulfosporosinus fructosivorans]|nr:response regulator [Desulfosporosinus fructosivorans]